MSILMKMGKKTMNRQLGSDIRKIGGKTFKKEDKM